MQQLPLFSPQQANDLLNLPKVNAKRRVAHLDMDAFFASVELLYYPQLKGLPVVIGGSRQQLNADQRAQLAQLPLESFCRLKDYKGRGVITTATYPARQFGVGSAMGLMKAAKLCPQAILLPSQFQLYREYSRQFKQIILQHASQLEDRGIDEVFVELTNLSTPQQALDERAWAATVQQEIYQATGLTCSIGIAPNKLLAKMASEFNKPKGISIIKMEDLAGTIWPLACKKINGVGPKVQQQLAQHGIETIGQLAKTELAWLMAQFGQSYGRWLYYAAQGIDNSAVQTKRAVASISRETTFSQDMHVKQDKQQLTQQLISLCNQVEQDLQRKGYAGKTITVKVKFADFKTITRSYSAEEVVTDAASILFFARCCLKRISFDDRLRLLGVRVSNLQPVSAADSAAATAAAASQTISLFTELSSF